MIVLPFSGQMRGKQAEAFINEAEKRGKTPAELAADILEAVVRDKLFTAVLDE